MSTRPVPLLAFLVLVLMPGGASAIDWVFETVDPDGHAGSRGSLALDSQGVPHIVYLSQVDANRWESRYATRTGGTWHVEPVSEYDDYRASTTVIILPGDVPAFSRTGMFRVRSGGTWTTEEMGGFSPWSSTVALAPDGSVHGQTQWSWGSGEYKGWVWAVQRRANGWGGVTLMETVFIPDHPNASMVVDASLDVHVSMTTGGDYPTPDDSLRYFHRHQGAWSGETMAPGNWSSIALDSQGTPRISFYEPRTQDLVLALRAGDTWIYLPLDVAGDVGLHTSQVIRNDASYVTYYDKADGDLMLAMFDGVQLTLIPVDTAGDVGAWTSLALDAQGRPHIAYQDVTNGALKYAVGNAPLATTRTTIGRMKSLYRK